MTLPVRFRSGQAAQDEVIQIRTRLLLLFTATVFALVIGCSGSDLEPTAEPTPESPSLDEVLSSIERGIEEIRGIDTPPPVHYRFVDEQGMRDRLAQEFKDPEIVSQIDHESTLLKLLGVIPQDSDLAETYDEILGSQVLGLYDPEKEEFFVLGDVSTELDGEAQLTYAHEYVHRLQDAAFDLESIEELANNDDMSIAISALIEGDATTAQTQYMLANFDFAELSAILQQALEAQGELPESPYFLQQSLEFPYTEGAKFVAALIAGGDFSPVDDAFGRLPLSTEQILHPEKYLQNEEPLEVDVPDDLADGWTVDSENVLGEFFLKTWLEAIGSDNAGVAAAGWGGDAYAIFESENEEQALVVFTEWDTSDDAREFMFEMSQTFGENQEIVSESSGLPGILEAWSGPGGYMVISRWEFEESAEQVRIVVAPDGATAHMLSHVLVPAK